MADIIYEKLLKARLQEEKLDVEFTVLFTKTEMEIILEKASNVGMELNDFIREYLTQSGIFNSAKKKARIASKNDKDNEGNL